MFDPGPFSQASCHFPAQEQPSKRPRLTPYEEPHILAAKARGAPPKQLPEFQDLLVDDFASGKASATRVTCFDFFITKFYNKLIIYSHIIHILDVYYIIHVTTQDSIMDG